MTRAGLVLRGWGGAAVGVAAAVALVGNPLPAPGASAAAGGARFEGSLLPSRTPVPDVALRDERGRTVRLRAVRGPYVVTFLTAVCRDACPVSAQTVRLALDQVGGRGVPAFAVAVDPRNDTRLNARRFLARQGLLGRMRFLLGDRRALAPAWRGFGVQPVTATSDHQARIVLVDARGHQRVGYFAEAATPEALAHDLRLLLNRRSAGS